MPTVAAANGRRISERTHTLPQMAASIQTNIRAEWMLATSTLALLLPLLLTLAQTAPTAALTAPRVAYATRAQGGRGLVAANPVTGAPTAARRLTPGTPAR